MDWLMGEAKARRDVLVCVCVGGLGECEPLSARVTCGVQCGACAELSAAAVAMGGIWAGGSGGSIDGGVLVVFVWRAGVGVALYRRPSCVAKGGLCIGELAALKTAFSRRDPVVPYHGI